MEAKTHWKSLVSNDYIGAYSLMQTGKAVDLTVKIKSVVRQIVKGEGGKEDECTVAQLEGQKPMILNRTNCKTITSIYGTPFIQDWAGKTITIYVAKVKVKGEAIDALRIRDMVPQPEKPVDMSKPLYKLNACKSLDDLQKTFLSLPDPERNNSEVIARKDELKKTLK